LKKKNITYKEAGVDITAGYKAVARIKKLVKPTLGRGVLSDIGLFGGAFEIDKKRYSSPVLVSGADGVGSKIKIAFEMDKHDTVGIDLVAMNVDDVVTMGAKPIFFLDYIACHKLDPKKIALLVSGMVKGCKLAGCALIGGETAEMPDLYSKGEYDLAGFAVGVVNKRKMIKGTGVRAGDVIIGLRSSGLHSNGYALARKVIFSAAGLKVTSRVSGLKRTVGEELLTPTRIYTKPILSLIEKVNVKGIAHITGGGLPENVARVLPKGTKALIYRKRWVPQAIFKVIERLGGISRGEMFKTFNMGIGMVVVVSQKESRKAIKELARSGEKAVLIGDIAKGKGQVEII